jgi:hypothetical protein
MNRREWVEKCQDLRDYLGPQLGRQDSAYHPMREASVRRDRDTAGTGQFNKIDRELAAYYHPSRRSL